MLQNRIVSSDEYIRNNTGKHFAIGAIVQKENSSLAFNIGGQSVGWRDNKNIQPNFQPTDPHFEFVSNTIVFSCEELNSLAENFEQVWNMIPDLGRNDRGTASVGRIGRNKNEMADLLGNLNNGSDIFTSILESLRTPIDTDIYEMRRQKKTWDLTQNADPTQPTVDGQRLLKAFTNSLKTFNRLPKLRGFGTNNKRNQGRPNKRCDLLRVFLEQNPKFGPLNYVNYELKPLNINHFKWESIGDPRTDSIDLLMEVEGAPVITEVKMDRDSFLSTALVQLLYYACPLACESQKNRLSSNFDNIQPDNNPWLCLLAETRIDEAENNRFVTDKNSVESFLELEVTQDLLRNYFNGVYIITVHDPSDDKVGDSFEIMELKEIAFN